MAPQPLGNLEAFLLLALFIVPGFLSWRLARKEPRLSPWICLGVGFFLSWLGFFGVRFLVSWLNDFRLPKGAKAMRGRRRQSSVGLTRKKRA